jgi:hypothetical protein
LAQRNVPGLNGPIPWSQNGATAPSYAINGGPSAFVTSPVSQLNGQAALPTVSPQTQSIQMQNLRNMCSLSLQGNVNSPARQVATPKMTADVNKNGEKNLYLQSWRLTKIAALYY